MSIVAAPDVKRYHRHKLAAVLGSGVLRVAFLFAAAFLAGPEIDRHLQAWVGPGRWPRLVALAVLYGVALELLHLPFALWSGFVVEHRHHLSTQTLGGWVRKRVKGYLFGGLLGLVLLTGLYALIWETGAWWWLWGAVGWHVLTLVLGRLVRVLILPLSYRVTPLDDADLLDRFRRLADGTGLRLDGVFRLHLSDETRKVNAGLAGLGRSRSVLLGDTLLTQFTPEEIEVVFAHELGHHVHRHTAKRISWSTATMAAGFLLAEVVVRPAAGALGYAGLEDPATLPLLLLFLAAFGLLLAPAEHALSRAFERQCDRFAVERTGRADAYRSALRKAARLNKMDPTPHRLIVWLFHDHPPVAERLALAAPTPSQGSVCSHDYLIGR